MTFRTVALSDAELLADIDATLISLLAVAYFGPAEQGTSESVRQACAAEVLLFRLRKTREAVAELRDALGIQTPARQPLNDERRGPGGPVQPPAPAGKEPAPGSATAFSGPVSESVEVVAHLAAGATSGREKSARPEGGGPGKPPSPAVAPNVPEVLARDEGRAVGAVGAATFTLPEPPALSFDDGRHRLVGVVRRRSS